MIATFEPREPMAATTATTATTAGVAGTEAAARGAAARGAADAAGATAMAEGLRGWRAGTTIAKTASMRRRISAVMEVTFRASGSVLVSSRSPDRIVRCGAYGAAGRNQIFVAQRPEQHQQCLACLGVRQVAYDRGIRPNREGGSRRRGPAAHGQG